MADSASFTPRRETIGSVGGVLSLVAVAIAAHVRSLAGWWLYDDPQLILHAMRTSLLEELFSPEKYRLLAAHTFTPLLTISFKIDLALAGLTPAVFYAHSLAAITLSAILLFFLLRRFIDPLFAWYGALAFLLAPATFLAARTLMIRHYVEGLALAVAALLLWTSERRSLARDVAAAALYLAAMLAKEVYAPLPLLMIVLAWQRDGVRRAAFRTIAPAVPAIVFIVWRYAMLESWGGFGEFVLSGAVAQLPRLVASHVSGWNGAVLLLFLMVVVLTAAAMRWTAISLLFLSAVVVAVAIPLVPLATTFDWRYTYAATAAVTSLVAVAAARSRLRLPVVGVILAAFLFLLRSGAAMSVERFEETTTAMKTEGRFVDEWSPSDGAILASHSPEWYLEGIATFRTMEGRGEGGKYILSLLPIAAGLVEEESVWSSGGGGSLVRLDRHSSAVVAGLRNSLTLPSGLNVSFHRRAHALRWQISPPDQQFAFVSQPGWAEYPIAATGWRRVPDAPERQRFRIRARSVDGWALSPPLPVPAEGEQLDWSPGEEPRIKRISAAEVR